MRDDVDVLLGAPFVVRDDKMYLVESDGSITLDVPLDPDAAYDNKLMHLVDERSRRSPLSTCAFNGRTDNSGQGSGLLRKVLF